MALKHSTYNQSQDDVYISKRSKAASVEITCKPVQKDLSCFCQAKSMRQAGEAFHACTVLSVWIHTYNCCIRISAKYLSVD